MSNVAFLVDGHLEKRFIQNVCPNKTVRILNCNGKSVSVTAIAKRVATHCRLFKGKFYPIIIIVDLEDRHISAQIFHNDLLHAIRNEGINDDIILGIPNQMIENWILADKKLVSCYTKKQPVWSGTPDGFNGKSHLKFLIEGYHETTIGVELLVKCFASRMCDSPTFKDFFDKLFSDTCWWLQR